ncbi:MAG: hypothetical protein ACKOW2_07865 [Sphingobacteriaceae bacterium]
MNDFDWQEEWENAARQEYEYYALATNEQLIQELRNKAWGTHYRIWDVIRDRKNMSMTFPLFEALKYLNDTYLFHDRRHCTEAIFQLIGLKNKQLKERIIGPSTSFNEEVFQQALKDLNKKILKKIISDRLTLPPDIS